MNNNLDKSIDLDNVHINAKPESAVSTEYAAKDEETPIVGSDWMARVNPELATRKTEESASDDASIATIETNGIDETALETKKTVVEEPQVDAPVETATEPAEEESNVKEYEGPGYVVDHSELEAVENNKKDELQVKYTGITPDTQKNIDKHLAEMDALIEQGKARKAEAEAQIEEEKKEEPVEEDNNDFVDKYESATVIIDKTGFGTIVNFTDSEREKLEKVKTIKLNEVETLSMNTLKTKKPKKSTDFNQVIKKRADFNSTNIVLPISGYTATVSGCSAYDLISLIEPVDNNPLLKMQNRWSIIHSKLESTSIGDMSFDEFLKNTASEDYETFLYGILCSTYPDDDSVDLTCEVCGKPFTHKYSVRSLIRVEEMSDELKDAIMRTVDASVNKDAAKECHDNAFISTVKRIKLPKSEIIVDVYVQSAHDLIIARAKDLDSIKDPQKATAAILSTGIRTAYIYDETDDSYFEIDEPADLMELVYQLSDIDATILHKVIHDLMEGRSIKYGLMDINCPHCQNHIDSLEIGLDEMLFQRYRQVMDSNLE